MVIFLFLFFPRTWAFRSEFYPKSDQVKLRRVIKICTYMKQTKKYYLFILMCTKHIYFYVYVNYNISDCYQYLFSESSIKQELLIQILILSYLVVANIGVLVFIYTNVWRKFLFILANIRFVFGSVLTFATKRPSNVLLLWQDHCFINEAFPNKTSHYRYKDI